MDVSTYEQFGNLAKSLIAMAYDVKSPAIIDIEENEHPERGFTMATVCDVSGRLFSVAIFPNEEIHLCILT
jgi:hypothetical protein